MVMPVSTTPLLDRIQEASTHIERLILDHTVLAELAFMRTQKCDLGHFGCEDHFHSIAYHTADCWCGKTEATCDEE